MTKGSKCFKNFFRAIDCFGAQIQFRINNESEHTSLFGGVVSLIFYVVALGYCAYNAVLFIDRTNVNFIFTNKIFAKEPSVNFTGNSFMFAFGVNYFSNFSDAYEVLGDCFEIELDWVHWKGDDDLKVENIPIEYCDHQKHFPAITEDMFYLHNLQNKLCPNYLRNLTLSGLNTDNLWQFMSINVTVKPENWTYIDTLTVTQPLVATMTFLDTGIIYDNLTDPLPKYIKNIQTSIDTAFIKNIDLGVAELHFTSDENWLWSAGNLTTNVIHDFDKETYISAYDRNELGDQYKHNLAYYYIQASQKKYIVERTYQKLPNLLADLSGLLSQILFLLYLYLSYSNGKLAEQKMITKTLTFKQKQVDYLFDKYWEIENKEREKSLNKINEPIKCKVSSNNSLKSIDSIHELEKEEMPKVNEKMQINNFAMYEQVPKTTGENINTDNQIELMTRNNLGELVNPGKNNTKVLSSAGGEVIIKPDSYKHYKVKPFQMLIYDFFCCKKKQSKVEILKTGEEKISFYLDVLTYIRKLQEVDILKYILLSKEQLSLFNFLSKPPISLNDSQTNIYNEYLEELKKSFTLNKEEIDKLLENYKVIHDKPNKSKKEEKLISLFTAEIEHLK